MSMSREELLEHRIYVPDVVDDRIKAHLLMGNVVLCYVHFGDSKKLMCLRLIEGSDKSPIDTFSLYSNYSKLEIDEAIFLKGNWYDIIPDDLPTLLKQFEYD